MSPASILIIEDNPANLELMSYLLRAFGYRVCSAGDGGEGLSVARLERPNLVVCDIQLPTMNGIEVARAMKVDPELREVPLLAVTAFAMVGDRDRILAAGFDGYLTKPIEPENFIPQIEHFLPQDVRAPRRA